MILNVCRSPVIHTVALKCKKQCEKLFATTCVQIHDCYRTDVLFMNVIYWSRAVLCHNFLDRRQLLHLEGKNFLFSMMYDMLEYAGKSNLPYSGSWLDLTQIFTHKGWPTWVCWYSQSFRLDECWLFPGMDETLYHLHTMFTSESSPSATG